MSKVFLRAAYNYDSDKVSQETGLDASFETSMKLNPDCKVHQAQQSAGPEHDVVNLVDKLVNFGVGAQMPVPMSGDFTNALDFHSSQNAISRARDEFLELPAHVRARFDHDPGKFIEFFNDPKNREEADSFGFIVTKPSDPVVRVDVVDSVDRRASLALKKAKADAGVE